MINLALDPDVNRKQGSRIQYILIISQKNLKFPVDSKKRQNREKKTHRPVFPIPFQNCLTACWLAPLCYRSGLVLVPPSSTAQWKHKQKHKPQTLQWERPCPYASPSRECCLQQKGNTNPKHSDIGTSTLHHQVFSEQQNTIRKCVTDITEDI